MDVALMQLQHAKKILKRRESFFFIVRQGTFSKVGLESKSLESSNIESNIIESKNTKPAQITRLNALESIQKIAKDSILLATTGKCGRELYELGDKANQLYMVGSMGCVSPLGLGISLGTNKKVIAIDGDSALLMRLGSMAANAYYTQKRNNFCHILLDNESHDSTGGQDNLSPFIDFALIAKACGYQHIFVAKNLSEFESYLQMFMESKSIVIARESEAIHKISKKDSKNVDCHDLNSSEFKSRNDNKKSKSPTNHSINKGAFFIYLKITKGSKENLGRPKITPKQVATRLNKFIKT